MFPTLLVILAVAVLYWFPIRRWMSRWGATASDLARVMAGDGLLVDPTYSGTTVVVVDAAPEHIWPWLVQIGYQRGGLYSYDWLDRLFGYLDAPSAEEILPEYGSIRVGDTIPLGRGPDWPVVEVVPERTLVVEPLEAAVTWAFVLVPIDERSTRLVTRVRYRSEPTLTGRLVTAAMGPAAFVMTRKMLLGIKRRAEALARRRRLDVEVRGSAPA